jgi:Na+-driven multidrug efflux pump
MMTALTRLSRGSFVSLLWPILIELGLGIGMNFYAMHLAARLSDKHAAALTLGSQLASATFVFFRILGAGVSVVVAQYLGAGQVSHAAAVARQCVVIAGWGAGALAVFFALAGKVLLLQLQADASLVALAAPFMLVLAPALLLDAFNAVGASVLRAHLKARDSLAIIFAMQLVLAATAAPFIGYWGLPGYALALLVSRSLACVLHYLTWRNYLQISFDWIDFFRPRWQCIKEVLAIGAPAAVENIAYQLAFIVSLGVATKLGSDALATHSYVWQTSSFIMLIAVGLGVSAEVLVGRLIGQSRYAQAQQLVTRVLFIGLGCALTLTVILAVNGKRAIGLFTSNPAIIDTGATLLWLAVLLELGRTCNLIVINSLRGTGDVTFPAQVGVVSMTVVIAGGSLMLGPLWGLVGLWIAYAADEGIRGLMMCWRWYRQSWLPYAQRRSVKVKQAQI